MKDTSDDSTHTAEGFFPPKQQSSDNTASLAAPARLFITTFKSAGKRFMTPWKKLSNKHDELSEEAKSIRRNEEKPGQQQTDSCRARFVTAS